MKKIIFLFLCGFILAEDEFMDLNGLMQYDNPEYIVWFKSYVEECKVNNANSCYLAGFLLRSGAGVEANYEASAKFYDKACKLNDNNGCSSLALAYTFGIGVEKNLQIAYKYDKKACNLGNGLSCYYIGTEYE
ncbi:tetratricopeptide repeat protein, partial [Campylobacter sp.]|uniref:tetratricopeptide repeat protein n=1 Tax=Campylobacter sp. TaxID=205 RepID=UPI002A81FDF9